MIHDSEIIVKVIIKLAKQILMQYILKQINSSIEVSSANVRYFKCLNYEHNSIF